MWVYNTNQSQLMKYKYITIKQVNDEVFEGKPVYRIYNNKTNKQLGIISFYKPWRDYVLSSQPECVFNSECLKDILDFIKKLSIPNVSVKVDKYGKVEIRHNDKLTGSQG